jgi:hypothetical protein
MATTEDILKQTQDHVLFVKNTRDQIIKEYEDLEKKKLKLTNEKRLFEEYKHRETSLIDNVKCMYTKHIEYYMLIKEVVDRYQVTPT